MVDFLKKYSTIPTQFIDDFYGIVKDYEELNYSFYISLDIVSRWMNQTKANVKRTLIKKFVKNDDYTLEKVFGNAGKPKEIILLKLSTFKNLCNLLNNKKSKEICKYFFHIEDILNKYKNYIIDLLK
jgi:phage anti-repressor protein